MEKCYHLKVVPTMHFTLHLLILVNITKNFHDQHVKRKNCFPVLPVSTKTFFENQRSHTSVKTKFLKNLGRMKNI